MGALREFGGLDGRPGRGKVAADDIAEDPDTGFADMRGRLRDGIGIVDFIPPVVVIIAETAAGGTAGPSTADGVGLAVPKFGRVDGHADGAGRSCPSFSVRGRDVQGENGPGVQRAGKQRFVLPPIV